MVWKPHVTVVAVIQRDNQFLLVEEHTNVGLRFNQPAGHLEAGESLVAAVIRETFEESAYHFLPTALVGIYQWYQAEHDRTYLRFAFTGEIAGHDADSPLDTGIVRAVWQDVDAIRASADRHRSPLVLHCIDDYLRGTRYPLATISTY
ncbi:MAG: NUDIX hydrolase [Sulfuriferula sp.]|nr:NUDIX hydrolase [Sulfuriferula sp.]